MPFSNSTKRQRCEKGQVVPEYKTIMAKTPQSQKAKNSGLPFMHKARHNRCGQRLARRAGQRGII
jgi:hypothetical protein